MTTKKTITINGTSCLIRGSYSVEELKRLYQAFVSKHGTLLTFERWLIQRGKVY